MGCCKDPSTLDKGRANSQSLEKLCIKPCSAPARVSKLEVRVKNCRTGSPGRWGLCRAPARPPAVPPAGLPCPRQEPAAATSPRRAKAAQAPQPSPGGHGAARPPGCCTTLTPVKPLRLRGRAGARAGPRRRRVSPKPRARHLRPPRRPFLPPARAPRPPYAAAVAQRPVPAAGVRRGDSAGTVVNSAAGLRAPRGAARRKRKAAAERGTGSGGSGPGQARRSPGQRRWFGAEGPASSGRAEGAGRSVRSH
ncbi:translation initiation factor IF-2-like [Passer montanus]|uniref:translation initiation factor IF-2-like n=1 Tax=Passer montanus TaxID=9160 RepID=UPI0019601ECC|nr:translation initiation factor IF-2-like [Passer montanus]